jgi:iron complex outermembrane recepter protein
MKHVSLLSRSALAAIACATFASAASAQIVGQSTGDPAQAPAAQPPGDAPEVVVTGVRASLRSAQQRKENASQIVDSIVAEDIGKLPDQNTTDALQRVTGVQIERDYGEGSSVYVRGLSQVETTLNGREIFTAQGTRGLNLQDIPAELLAGIDVYKSPSANLLEGGLGGTIDLRTRKPFDFTGLTISGSAKGNYSDLVDKVKPSVSGLIADRWNTGIGEIGALLSVSYQERAFRADLISTGTPASSTTIVPGRTVIAPNGAYDVTPFGDRKRLGIDGSIQWRPAQNVELYLEGHYAKFDNPNDNYGASVSTAGLTAQPGATVAANGDVTNVTYNNAPDTVLSYAYDTHDKMYQIAGGGKWSEGRVTLSTDISYTKATGNAIFNGAFTANTIPTFSQNVLAFVPTSDVHGYDLVAPANNVFSFLSYSDTENRADEFAGKLDGTWNIDAGFLRGLDFGLRYADRTAGSVQNSFYLGNTIPATAIPSLTAANPASDFFRKVDSSDPLLGPFLVIPVPLLRDHLTQVQTTLGFSATAATPGPLTEYNVSEKTYTAYGMLRFGQPSTLVDGNIGLRFIHTHEVLAGNQSVSGGGVAPIGVDSSYNDWLPQVNVRFNFTQKLKLRLAASKAVTRPNFSDLSPTLTLNSVQGNGSAGNPYLKPLKADQLDASLEYYFSKTGSIYGAFFYKKVTNFISSTADFETYQGFTYTVTRPTNNQDGTIKGAEVGYQQFFDKLPGPLSGLGAQANFTYIDSATTSSIIGETTPLQGLSKYSYNLVGIYEKYGVSLRAAYNWRSTYFDSTYPINGTVQPSYRRGYGWLDGSLVYDLTKNIALSVEGVNLTRAIRRSYYNDLISRPHETQIDDRQILFGVRAKL